MPDTPAGISTVDRALAPDPPLAAAHLAGLLHDAPSPAQVGQGATDTNWPNMLRAARRTSPLPPQVVQGVGLVPGLAPLPSHALQRSSALSLTVFLTPVATSVRVSRTVTRMSWPAARRPPRARRRRRSTRSRPSAEVAHEDVERFAQIDVVEPEARRRPPTPGLAVAVVGRALLRIAEHLVRLGDLLEPLLGLGRGVPVGMVLHGELAVRLLDLGLGRVARHAQQRVEFAHSSNPSTRRLVCSTSPMILSYGMRVGPITPMTPLQRRRPRYDDVTRVKSLSAGIGVLRADGDREPALPARLERLLAAGRAPR